MTFTFATPPLIVPQAELTRLSDLPSGCCAVIASVESPVAELMEMGFVPGTAVIPRYSGLGGDPRVYELEGSLVALRRAAAGLIRVVNGPQIPVEEQA